MLLLNIFLKENFFKLSWVRKTQHIEFLKVGGRKVISQLTPDFVIVGTAARLSTAVSCFTQVTGLVVYPRTVFGTDCRLAVYIPMMLHHLVDKTEHHNHKVEGNDINFTPNLGN